MLHQIQQQNINKPKQITITTNKIGSFYTVPKGKVFKGHVYISMNVATTFAINGQSTIPFVPSNNLNSVQLKLFEGDTISLINGTQISLIGVEYDA